MWIHREITVKAYKFRIYPKKDQIEKIIPIQIFFLAIPKNPDWLIENRIKILNSFAIEILGDSIRTHLQ